MRFFFLSWKSVLCDATPPTRCLFTPKPSSCFFSGQLPKHANLMLLKTKTKHDMDLTPQHFIIHFNISRLSNNKWQYGRDYAGIFPLFSSATFVAHAWQETKTNWMYEMEEVNRHSGDYWPSCRCCACWTWGAARSSGRLSQTGCPSNSSPPPLNPGLPGRPSQTAPFAGQT